MKPFVVVDLADWALSLFVSDLAVINRLAEAISEVRKLWSLPRVTTRPRSAYRATCPQRPQAPLLRPATHQHHRTVARSHHRLGNWAGPDAPRLIAVVTAEHEKSRWMWTIRACSSAPPYGRGRVNGLLNGRVMAHQGFQVVVQPPAAAPDP